MEFVGARFVRVKGRALTREQWLPELYRIIAALCAHTHKHTHSAHIHDHTQECQTSVPGCHKHTIVPLFTAFLFLPSHT